MTTLLHIWQTRYHSDFAAGVRLLTEHNPGAVTRSILARLQTLAATGDYVGRYEQGKLEYALHNTRLDADESAFSEKTGKAEAPRAVPTPEQVQQQHDPATLTSDRAKGLHKEHAHVHALMVAATTDEERGRYAADIMQRIIPALDAEYDRLRAEASAKASPTGTDGDAPIAPILNATDARAFKKLQSVRSRISTLRKKIAEEKDRDKKAKWQRELEKKEVERDRLQTELEV